jgi:hypothetical protein
MPKPLLVRGFFHAFTVGREWGANWFKGAESGKRWLKKEKSGVKWGIKQTNLGKGASKKCF